MVEAITLAAIVGTLGYALGVYHEQQRAQADWNNYMGWLEGQRGKLSRTFRRAHVEDGQ